MAHRFVQAFPDEYNFPAINARRFSPTIRAREDAESLKSEWGRPFLDVRWQVLCARLIQKMNYPR